MVLKTDFFLDVECFGVGLSKLDFFVGRTGVEEMKESFKGRAFLADRVISSVGSGWDFAGDFKLSAELEINFKNERVREGEGAGVCCC